MRVDTEGLEIALAIHSTEGVFLQCWAVKEMQGHVVAASVTLVPLGTGNMAEEEEWEFGRTEGSGKNSRGSPHGSMGWPSRGVVHDLVWQEMAFGEAGLGSGRGTPQTCLVATLL